MPAEPPRRVRHPSLAPAEVLLEGPHSRLRELWLVLRTVRDFIAGFRVLHFAGPCVTVWSAWSRRGLSRGTT